MAKKEEIVADLKELLETDPNRSKVGRIWEVYDEIMELKLGGVSMKNIEERLNARGFGLKPGNLASYLYQIRKKKKGVVASVEPTQSGAKQEKPARVQRKGKKGPATPDSLDEKKTNMEGGAESKTLGSVKKDLSEKQDTSRFDVD
jgi:hypothetical protein